MTYALKGELLLPYEEEVLGNNSRIREASSKATIITYMRDYTWDRDDKS